MSVILGVVLSVFLTVAVVILLSAFYQLVYDSLFFEKIKNRLKKTVILLKFSDFKRFYTLAPSKWNLKSNIYTGGLEQYTFRFSFIDTFKYYIFKIHLSHVEKSKKESQLTKKFLMNIKKDLDDYKISNIE